MRWKATAVIWSSSNATSSSKKCSAMVSKYFHYSERANFRRNVISIDISTPEMRSNERPNKAPEPTPML